MITVRTPLALTSAAVSMVLGCYLTWKLVMVRKQMHAHKIWPYKMPHPIQTSMSVKSREIYANTTVPTLWGRSDAVVFSGTLSQKMDEAV